MAGQSGSAEAEDGGVESSSRGDLSDDERHRISVEDDRNERSVEPTTFTFKAFKLGGGTSSTTSGAGSKGLFRPASKAAAGTTATTSAFMAKKLSREQQLEEGGLRQTLFSIGGEGGMEVEGPSMSDLQQLVIPCQNRLTQVKVKGRPGDASDEQKRKTLPTAKQKTRDDGDKKGKAETQRESEVQRLLSMTDEEAARSLTAEDLAARSLLQEAKKREEGNDVDGVKAANVAPILAQNSRLSALRRQVLMKRGRQDGGEASRSHHLEVDGDDLASSSDEQSSAASKYPISLTPEEEKKLLKMDLEMLPDMTPSAYEDVPIEQFGLAMLLGMGYDPSKEAPKPLNLKRRFYQRAGLGADRELESGFAELEKRKKVQEVEKAEELRTKRSRVVPAVSRPEETSDSSSSSGAPPSSIDAAVHAFVDMGSPDDDSNHSSQARASPNSTSRQSQPSNTMYEKRRAEGAQQGTGDSLSSKPSRSALQKSDGAASSDDNPRDACTSRDISAADCPSWAFEGLRVKVASDRYSQYRRKGTVRRVFKGDNDGALSRRPKSSAFWICDVDFGDSERQAANRSDRNGQKGVPIAERCLETTVSGTQSVKVVSRSLRHPETNAPLWRQKCRVLRVDKEKCKARISIPSRRQSDGFSGGKQGNVAILEVLLDDICDFEAL